MRSAGFASLVVFFSVCAVVYYALADTPQHPNGRSVRATQLRRSEPTESVIVNLTLHSDNFGHLIADAAGNMYGFSGPTEPASGDRVFQLTRKDDHWKLGVIAKFGHDTIRTVGFGPRDIAINSNGVIFGVNGDWQAHGTVFSLSPSSNGYETSLVKRLRTNLGSEPDGLVLDGAGNIFVDASRGGGKRCGSILELTPSPTQYAERILHAFDCNTDGASPAFSITMDKRGAIYGVTVGPPFSCSGVSSQCGTVFKLTPSGSGYTFSSIHTFDPTGWYPQGGPIVAPNGTVYGTTWFGGNGGPCGQYGCGTVYQLTPGSGGYQFRTIYAFSGGSDGDAPQGALFRDNDGRLYGATYDGGGVSCAFGLIGCGVIFELTPSGSGFVESIAHTFGGPPGDGESPRGTLIKGPDGALYGATEFGGDATDCQCGTIFRITI
jgi:uncharacterized repeat protein (TIGR03803 family)